jgi:predicted nucleic acid-binding protein
MIVVDSNILAYLYLPGPYAIAAERLLTDDPDWAAPLLWRSEFRNILAGYLRRGLLTIEQTIALQTEAESLLAGAEYAVDSAAVLQLVAASDCSAYDCEFIALAMQLQTRLVTMDGKLLKSFAQTTQALPKATAT